MLIAAIVVVAVVGYLVLGKDKKDLARSQDFPKGFAYRDTNDATK